MPKNSGKGGKGKRKGKGSIPTSREIIIKDSGQEYGKVVKMSGDCRLEVLCFDGVTRLARIRGKMKKRVWISRDDIVLVGLRDYQNNKCDVIHRYTLQEFMSLKRMGEIPSRIGVDSNSYFTRDTGGEGVEEPAETISYESDGDTLSNNSSTEDDEMYYY